MQSGIPQPSNISFTERSTLIGRDQDIAMLTNLLQRESIRLITLVGPQGSGKTSLSLHVAQELDHLFEHGIAYLMLENLKQPEILHAAIREHLDIEADDQLTFDQLLETLEDKHVLFVFDTFDQNIDQTNLIRDMLDATKNVKILVTNKDILGLPGEYEYKVFPLTLPEAGVITKTEQLENYSATQLFIERSRERTPDFNVNIENSLAIVEICTHLEGLPLAIELVAAQTHLMPLNQIWEQLRPYLDFHTPGSRDRSIRQQTLQATIKWVTSLLSPDQKYALPQLALFQSFTSESSKAVCRVPENGELTDTMLQDFIDRRIIQVDGNETVHTRYYIQDTIRSFALNQFADNQDSAQNHERFVDYYLRLAEASQAGLNGPDQNTWMLRLRDEHNNFRIALQWALSLNNATTVLQICSALWRFWITRGLIGEGRHWFELAFNQPTDTIDPLIKATGLNRLASLCSIQGDYDRASILFKESLEIQKAHNNLEGMAATYNNLGMTFYQQGIYNEAKTYFRQSSTIYRTINNNPQLAMTLNNLGLVNNEKGDYQQAQEVLEECLTIWRQSDNKWGLAVAKTNLAEALEAQGQLDQASKTLKKALTLAKELGDKDLSTASQISLARVLTTAGDYQQASKRISESFIQLQDSGNKLAIADAFLVAAVLCTALKRYTLALQTLAVTKTIRNTLGSPLPPVQQKYYEQAFETSRLNLGADFEHVWNAGITHIDDLKAILTSTSIKLQDIAEHV